MDTPHLRVVQVHDCYIVASNNRQSGGCAFIVPMNVLLGLKKDDLSTVVSASMANSLNWADPLSQIKSDISKGNSIPSYKRNGVDVVAWSTTENKFLIEWLW